MFCLQVDPFFNLDQFLKISLSGVYWVLTLSTSRIAGLKNHFHFFHQLLSLFTYYYFPIFVLFLFVYGWTLEMLFCIVFFIFYIFGESTIRASLDPFGGFMISWVFAVLLLEAKVSRESYFFWPLWVYFCSSAPSVSSSLWFWLGQLAMSLGGRVIFKFSRWLDYIPLLLYIQVRQLFWFFLMWQDY